MATRSPPPSKFYRFVCKCAASSELKFAISDFRQLEKSGNQLKESAKRVVRI